jgi:hypothetical protein
MPQRERSDQQDYGSLIRFRRPQSLDLHVVPQHQLLWILMQVDLLVYPTLRWAQAPTRAADGGSGNAWAGAKLRQEHDQRQQSLPVLLNKTQGPLLVLAR